MEGNALLAAVLSPSPMRALGLASLVRLMLGIRGPRTLVGASWADLPSYPPLETRRKPQHTAGWTNERQMAGGMLSHMAGWLDGQLNRPRINGGRSGRHPTDGRQTTDKHSGGR